MIQNSKSTALTADVSSDLSVHSRIVAAALFGAIAIFLSAPNARSETRSPASSAVEVVKASAKRASEAQPSVGWKTPSKAARMPIAFG